MGLKDQIVKALALRYARGKVDDLRGKDKDTGMGKVLKVIDGWKLLIGTAVLFGLKTFDAYHGGHTANLFDAIVSVLGWKFTPDDLATSGAVVDAGLKMLASAVMVWGSVHKLVKAQQQLKAGAAPSELLSTEGHVAQAIAVMPFVASESSDFAKKD